MPTTLSAADARRIALAAQGFGKTPSATPAGTRRLRSALGRLKTLQIDSVNVFARSHYLPLYSRVGGYDPAALDRLLFRRGAPWVEYWAHVAAFVPREDWGLFAFRMQEWRERFARPDGFVARHGDIVDWVRAELADRGPLRPAQFDHDLRRRAKGAWWDWDVVKQSLEHLWLIGEVAIAGRRGFERMYALAEHVLSDAERTPVPAAEAVRELVGRAAAAHGIATAADISDYWRLRDRAAVAAAIGELVDVGDLEPVTVAGWTRAGRPVPAWRHRDATRPRRVSVTTILTPFDPVVWFRDRAERVFGFDYRIEIYTPAHKRRFGYYSLPVLMDDALVGRVDLKADRRRSTLLVQSAWWEPGARPADAGERLAAHLRDAGRWQQLAEVSVGRWGDAADELAAALGTATARHDRER
ncbi:winged helix-turn-helix domain-containing protein [Microbacterium sp.]|uniref:winged helix-turn-helix domain-containing protein n=1 Tax=Microbacterium sp. TaxID=51671 RepID=UPI003A8C7EC4